MTSATSSVKPASPFWKMLVFTLKKNRAIILLGSIVSLLAIPVLPVTTYIKDGLISTENFIITTDEDSLMTGCLALVWAINLLMVAVLGATNLNFLHHKNGSDLFHALPMTRKQLYLSRLTATVIGAMIPAAVSMVSGWSLAVLTFGASHIPLHTLLRVLLFYLLSTIIVSIMVGLFMLLTGHTFDAVLSFFGINLGLPILLLSCGGYAQSNLFGITDTTLEHLAPWNLSPIGTLGAHLINLISTLFSPTVTFTDWISIELIVWCLLSGGLLFFSLLFATRRRSEKAGEAYAHPILPTALQLLIAILVAFAAGEIFSLLDSFTLSYYIFAVIGALLSAVLLGAIIRRGFKGFKKDLLTGGIAGTLAICFGISIMTGWFGFETRVPAVADIKEAVVFYNYGVSNLTDSHFTKAEDLEHLTKLHQAIIDKNGPYYYSLLTGRRYRNEFGESEDLTRANYARMEVTYTLKNGQTMERSYHFYDKPLTDALRPVLQSKDFLNCYTLSQTAQGKHAVQMDYYSADGEWNVVNMPAITLEQAQTILAAYRTDIQSGTLDGTNAFYLHVNDILILDTTEEMRSLVEERDGFSLSLNHSFTNTIRILEGFGFNMEPILNAQPDMGR